MKKNAILIMFLLGSMLSMPLLISAVHAGTPPPGLDATDLNNDGTVNLLDLVGFASVYRWTSATPGWNDPIQLGWRLASEADFNGNGRIDLADLTTLAFAYAYVPPP